MASQDAAPLEITPPDKQPVVLNSLLLPMATAKIIDFGAFTQRMKIEKVVRTVQVVADGTTVGLLGIKGDTDEFFTSGDQLTTSVVAGVYDITDLLTDRFVEIGEEIQIAVDGGATSTGSVIYQMWLRPAGASET